VHASRVELVGVARTVTFLDNVLRKYWQRSTLRVVEANGGAALLVTDTDGTPQALVTLDGSERGIERVYIQNAPSKLRRFAVRT
jgi:RNA polymerase sigma-70 factor (ECF subfamily)